MTGATRGGLGLAGCVLLGACATAGGGVASATRPAGPVRAPAPSVQRTATAHMAPGLEGVIGATSADLVRQFGPARIDVLEGDARKLQFSATACVLDVYLFPERRGADPRATYVDARRSSDGQDVDRAACVAAMRRPR